MLRAISVLAVLCVVMGCGGATQTHPLSLRGPEARASFPGIEACAKEKGYQAAVHSDAVHVQVQAAQWLYFRVGADDSFSLVAHAMTDSAVAQLPELKRLGDELWGCAVKRPPAPQGPAPAEPAPEGPAPAPAEPTPETPQPAVAACAAKSDIQCKENDDCKSYNCTGGYCYANEPGNPCEQDADCKSYNCSANCCQTRDPGAACKEADDCASYNCTEGKCQSGHAGSLCVKDADCKDYNCTAGKCQKR